MSNSKLVIPGEVTWCVLACLLAFLIAFITTTSAVLFFSKSYERVPAQECLVVSTSSGKVQGALVEFTVAEKSHSTVAFYGIPFASPPVEKRRFAPPTCPTQWKDAFNATYKRPPCAEHNTVLTKNHVIDAPNTTEDCLHVNVWVPGSCVDRKPSHRRAIVFWLHGGSFVFGGNSYDFYDGRFMAALGDVVVVVPNYRVWSFGFLNSETADVAGNMALHDVLLALNWVQRNAERFGGDPDRILGAGQSAGAIIVSLLMASPLTSARASFRRAYLLSGSMHTPLPGNTGDFAKENFDKLATIAGCVQADVPGKLHCMRGLNASALIRANRAIPMSIMPSFEAPLFPGRPDRFLRSRGVDTIMGTTLNEGMAMFQQLWPNVVENHVKVTIGAIIPSFGYIFAGVSDRELASAIQLLGAFYNIDDPDNKGWIDLFGDVLFHCPQIALGKQLSAIGKKVFFRKYVPKPSFSKFAGDGATHGEDATMLFGVPFLYPTISTDEEKTMSLRMISTIANFAKDG
ncbi:acetylcholinesterase-1-like [Haemaphysalis longicornis]